MKNNKLISLSVGIPAHNEEKNISTLLDKLIAQKQISYKLNNIYVVCDGCTDNTALIVRRYSKKFDFIKLRNDKKRMGKAMRLNMIYAMNESDFIATIDADVLPEDDMVFEHVIKKLKKNTKKCLAVPRYIPLKPKTLMGWFSYVSYLSFEDAYRKLNGGNNNYAIMGCASIVSKKLSKSFVYPNNTIADHAYLYKMANKNGRKGMIIVNNAHVLFRTVDTFKDWRVLGVRSVIMDKQNAVDLIGKDILKTYTMPKKLYFRSLLKWLFKSPFYTTGAILMNIYIRKFPYYKAVPKNGVWQLTESSKSLAL